MTPDDRLSELLALLFQSHPWHGVSAGKRVPDEVTAFVEITPAEAVKYELDKPSGLLRVDRPQRFSNLSPTLYGFIPQTYCREEVAARCMEHTGRTGIIGDGDPLDVCILTEKGFTHGSFLVGCRPIGGLRMIDADEADDKIIAVLDGDLAFGGIQELTQVPPGLLERLRHYFLTYKQLPGESARRVDIPEIYGAEEAREVIRRSVVDYRKHFGAPEGRLAELKRLLAG